MNVVWHDHEGMPVIVAKSVGVVLDGFGHQVGNGGLAEVERTRTGLVQEAVQGDKGLS